MYRGSVQTERGLKWAKGHSSAKDHVARALEDSRRRVDEDLSRRTIQRRGQGRRRAGRPSVAAC
jgi:hypothetical protein